MPRQCNQPKTFLFLIWCDVVCGLYFCIHFIRVPKNIDRKNLQTIHECEVESFIGKGAFGTCSKRQYKGIDVAAKTYESSVRKSDVLWEASIVNLFDHAGKYHSNLFKYFLSYF